MSKEQEQHGKWRRTLEVKLCKKRGRRKQVMEVHFHSVNIMWFFHRNRVYGGLWSMPKFLAAVRTATDSEEKLYVASASIPMLYCSCLWRSRCLVKMPNEDQDLSYHLLQRSRETADLEMISHLWSLLLVNARDSQLCDRHRAISLFTYVLIVWFSAGLSTSKQYVKTFSSNINDVKCVSVRSLCDNHTFMFFFFFLCFLVWGQYSYLHSWNIFKIHSPLVCVSIIYNSCRITTTDG